MGLAAAACTLSSRRSKAERRGRPNSAQSTRPGRFAEIIAVHNNRRVRVHTKPS